MRRRAKASQSDDEEHVERSASPHYSSEEDDERGSEGAEQQNDEDGHENATNDKEEQNLSNKKKEEKAKPEDPSFVPKSGRFFMHDDRAEDVKENDSREQKKLWSEEQDEGVWLHDKFNELSVKPERQRGRRNNYSKNNKYVNKRDNTQKDKHTSQQQYRRKTEPQETHEPTESKAIQHTTQNTSNGSNPHSQNQQPKHTSYRVKQQYRNSDASSNPPSTKEGSKRYSSQRGTPAAPSQSISPEYQQQVQSQDYSSGQQYPKQQMKPTKSYVPRSHTNPKPASTASPVPVPVPEGIPLSTAANLTEYNVISSASSMQYNYGYNVPAMPSQYPPGVYNPYIANYSYQYPYPYIPSIPSVVPPTDPAIISQGSIQYYSVPYVEDPTRSKKAPVNDINGSSQNSAKSQSQWIPKRSHAIPIKEPPPETQNPSSKSTQ